MDNVEFEDLNVNFRAIKNKLIRNINFKNNSKKKNGLLHELYNCFSFNNLKIKNHFLFMNLSDENLYCDNCKPNLLFDQFYSRIAKSGVGLIVSGGVFNWSNKTKDKSSNIDIDSIDARIKHNNLVNKIHAFGSKMFLQIKPLFGRHDENNKFLNIFNYSPSMNNSISNSYLSCVRISDTKCNEMVENFVKITKFSQDVGYDGVLINGDLFNIIGEFSSYEFNRRIFGYYSEKSELSLKILNAIQKECKSLNIIYSITINNLLQELYGDSLRNIDSTKKINAKTKINYVCEFLIKLIKNGVDGFIFRFGTYENEFMYNFNEFEEENLFFELYSEIRNWFNQNNIKNKFGNDILLVYYDNFSSLENVNFYCKNKIIDFIDVTKDIYADCDFLKKYLNKTPVNDCIKCGFCAFSVSKINKVECMINPSLYDEKLKLLNENKTKKVAVVGGGISGICCANFLAERNYNVSLFESNEKLNKNGRLLEIYGYNKCFSKFNNHIENKLKENQNCGKVKLFLKTKFDVDYLKENFDMIIIATGFHERLLDVSGSVLKNVKSIYDILSDIKFVNEHDKVLIYAKSELSLKLALFFALKGKGVKIIFPDFQNIIDNISNDRFSYYFYQLNNFHVNVYINAKIKKIEEDFAEILINNKYDSKNFFPYAMNLKSNKKYSYEPKIIMVDYDLVVYEPELYSNNRLYYDFVSKKYDGELFMIGNALEISDLANTIKTAYFVAKNL